MSTALERVRKAKQAEEVARLRKEQVDELSTGQRLLVGAGQGMTNVARNVGNMVGLVSDEEMAEAKELDRAILDTGAGKIGAFGGEMAALAPLGAVGSVARGAAALPKALRTGKAVLPAARGAGLPGAAAALTEGGLAGAILADPNERGAGAAAGAATAGLFNQTLGALGRKTTKGFDESAAARELSDSVEELTGKKISLPVAQSAKSDAVKYPHRSVLSMFPLARGGSSKMEAKALDDWQEAVLTQTFGKKHLDTVREELSKADGDFVTAGHALLRRLESKGYADNKKALRKALEAMKKGEKFTPNKLDAASKTVAKGEQRPFYTLTSNFAKITSEPLEESTVSGRRAYNKIMNKAAPAALGAAVTGGALPYMAVTAGTRAATAAPFQNFMMGRTGLNRAMDATGRAISPYAGAVRNTIAGNSGS